MAIALRALAVEIYRLAKLHRLSSPGSTRLVKLVYLADVEWRPAHEGVPLTCASWRFSHFGPYAAEFSELFGAEDMEVIEQKGKPFHRLQFLPEELESSQVPAEVSRLLDGIVKEWGDADLNMLLDYVYFHTAPMRTATRGSYLDFSTLEAVRASVKSGKLDASKLEKIRQRLQQRSAVLNLRREPLKVRYAGRDVDAAWAEDFKESALPSGLEFKLSD